MKHAAFVFLCAAICVVMSERIFWFWAPGLLEFAGVTAFYALPTAFTLWAMSTYRVDGRWSMLLATPLFAYVTEGVITPVLYSGGPLVPFFPAWFSFWHGIMAFGFVLLVIRSWLLAAAWKPLAAAAVGIGVFWGVWASTMRTPENLDEPDLIEEIGPLVVLDPAAFTRYTIVFSAVLIAAHWLLGLVWPERYEPGRMSKVVVGALIAAGTIVWTVVIPWALPMFAVYTLVQRWGLRRHAATAKGPDIFARLHGRVRLVALVPLTFIAPAASATYAAIWALDPSDLALNVVFYSVIAVQTLAGGWLTIAALRKARSPQTATIPTAPAIM